MKNNIYSLLLLLFLFCVFVTNPLFAVQEREILSRQEIEAKLVDDMNKSGAIVGNYLKDKPLDYLNYSSVIYMKIRTGGIKSWYRYDCTKSKLSEIEDKYDKLTNSKLVPGTICNQFDIASYLISKNHKNYNRELNRLIYDDTFEDHAFDIYNVFANIKNNNKPDRIVTLFTVAILSNNKGAIDVLLTDIKDHLDQFSKNQIYSNTIKGLVYYVGQKENAQDHYNAVYQDLIENKIQGERLKNAIIKAIVHGDKPRVDAISDYIFYKVSWGGHDDLMKDVFYGLIDYRIENNIN